MAQRLPPAGVKTQYGDMFRFGVVVERPMPPRPKPQGCAPLQPCSCTPKPVQRCSNSPAMVPPATAAGGPFKAKGIVRPTNCGVTQPVNRQLDYYDCVCRKCQGQGQAPCPKMEKPPVKSCPLQQPAYNLTWKNPCKKDGRNPLVSINNMTCPKPCNCPKAQSRKGGRTVMKNCVIVEQLDALNVVSKFKDSKLHSGP